MPANSAYRKLPGRAPGFAGTTGLWMGEDHLLSVTGTFGVETYRRFYFHTIRSIVCRRTAGRRNWNIAFGVVGAASAGGSLLIWFGVRQGKNITDDDAAAFFAAIFAALAAASLLFAILNSIRGQTCNTFIQTASGMERLGVPVRLPTARRMIEIAAPVIAARQAEAASTGIVPPVVPEAPSGAAIAS